MSSVPQSRRRATIAEYLAAEAVALEKHEYRDGEIVSVFADPLGMAGGSGNHSLITMNVGGELRALLKGKPCTVYDSNLRIRTPSSILFTYPDVTVICGHRQADPDDPSGQTFTNPKLIVEVLSPSTEAFDRGDKFDRYRRIETLEEYVLVSTDTPRVEIFSRPHRDAPSDDRALLFTWVSGLDGIATLSSLHLQLPLAEIYRGVEFLPSSAL
jgi:Uma2 family endonuclease